MIIKLILLLIFSIQFSFAKFVKIENFRNLFNDTFNEIGKQSSKFVYSDNGDLVIGSYESDSFNGPIPLYFDPYTYKCKDKDKQNTPGLGLEIIFCTESKTIQCDKGMTICYPAQLTKEKLKDEKYALQKYRSDDVKCQDPEHHGFNIRIIDRKEVEIRLIFDKHIYKFPLPEVMNGHFHRCFKIKIGHSESIGAIITNMNDEKLIFTGNPPLKLEDNFWYSKKETNNFWMLSLDFIPMRNIYYNTETSVDYTTEFVYRAGQKCNIAAQFRGYDNCEHSCVLGCYFIEHEYISEVGDSGDPALNSDVEKTFVLGEEIEVSRTTGVEIEGKTSTNKQKQIDAKLTIENFEIGHQHSWGSSTEDTKRIKFEDGKVTRVKKETTVKYSVKVNAICSVKKYSFNCYGYNFVDVSYTKGCVCNEKDELACKYCCKENIKANPEEKN